MIDVKYIRFSLHMWYMYLIYFLCYIFIYMIYIYIFIIYANNQIIISMYIYMIYLWYMCVCVCANRLILHEHLGILDIFPHLVLHQGHISSGPSGYRVLFRSSPQWASIPRWQTYVGAACQSPQLCMGDSHRLNLWWHMPVQLLQWLQPRRTGAKHSWLPCGRESQHQMQQRKHLNPVNFWCVFCLWIYKC